MCAFDCHCLFSLYLGWCIDSNGDQIVDWLTLPAAPQSVLEFLSCKCKTGCAGGSCSCRRHMLHCTDVCGCRHDASVPCANRPSVNEGEEPYALPEE